MKDSFDIIVKPLLTEKSNQLRETRNQVAFKVRKDANKIEIKKAVEDALKVKVASVNVMRVQGKIKRLGKFEGKTSDWKKAIVTLKPGEKISIFEGL
ncbi:MAG: 50S ribosomal protein L23 [Nitrospirae bacterium]|nr:50S ribosomal protein L23 [Nitrospirota bacterium]MBI3606327.1 50S ribosomal protein L23 [Nitrospirota bacterium]